jgi:hypothetical protein
VNIVAASEHSRLPGFADLLASHRDAIDVVNVNDWAVGDPDAISTNATTSVPPVS